MRFITLFHSTVLACAALLPSASSAQASRNASGASEKAPTQRSDFLVVTGAWDHVSAQPEGGNWSVDWLHTVRPGRAVGLGAATYAVGDSHWTLGRAGASFPIAKRWSLDAQMSLGGGSAGSSGFTYQQYRGRIAYRTSSRLYIHAQEEYLDIANSHGHLLRTGAYLLLPRLISADLTYAHSAGGNLGTEFVLGRMDLNRAFVRPFGGFAVGRTAPQIFTLGVGRELVAQSLREGFVGAVFPISTAELTVALDWTHIGRTQKRTLTAGLKFAVGKSHRLGPKS